MAGLENKSSVRYGFILLGLSLFCGIFFFLDLQPGHPEVTYTAAIAALMALWWVTEALPIGVTSLLPILLFPALGIVDGKAISDAYINYVIFLFIGGFIMALAIEKWGLHQRIALWILRRVGGSPFRILFGFMFASAFLSMWMSNTATAMMMLPIGLSVSRSMVELHGEERIRKYSVGLLLSIAYACSIGGIATLVGTPPNLSFIRIFEIIYPNAPEISFGQWFFFALPLSGSMFFLALFYLYFLYRPKGAVRHLEEGYFKERYRALGPMQLEEKRVLALFALLVFLWVFRKDLLLGKVLVPGWGHLFPDPSFLNDGTVAIFVALLLFLVPSGKKGEGLVTWQISKSIPWRIVLLFGGGFALAQGFIDSGLSAWVGEQLVGAETLSLIGLMGMLSGAMSLLTEFTSNTATAEMMLPIVAGLANEIQVHPLALMIPVTLAASMAFMFPIATPPNAIIYSSGRFSMWEMLKAGFFLNILAVVLITLLTVFWAPSIFELDWQFVPEWAEKIGAGH